MSVRQELSSEVLGVLSNGKKVITASVTEKIPTAKYANTDIHASVIDAVDDVAEGIKDAFEKVEEGLKPERDQILEDLEGGN